MLKKILLIIVLFLFSIGIIYFKEIKNKIIKDDDIYIVFDLNKDSTTDIDWESYMYLFSNDFELDKIANNIYKGSNFGRSDKRKFDSLVNSYNRLPLKFINRIGNRKEFGIRVSNSESYVFSYNDFKSMDTDEIKDLNALSSDSIVKILYENTFDPKKQWHIIQIDYKKDIASVAKAKLVIVDDCTFLE